MADFAPQLQRIRPLLKRNNGTHFTFMSRAVGVELEKTFPNQLR